MVSDLAGSSILGAPSRACQDVAARAAVGKGATYRRSP
jgi:hypothetical protein